MRIHSLRVDSILVSSRIWIVLNYDFNCVGNQNVKRKNAN